MEEDEEPIELNCPVISIEDMPEGARFETVYRKEIAEAVCLAIFRMVTHELVDVPVFMIEESGLIFQLDRESMSFAVDGCIEYYTEVENYELCADLLSLKNIL
jgi:hypothetical protein